MIKVMKEYIDDIRKKCAINKGKNKEQFLESIRKITESYRKQKQNQKYFKYNDVKFYQLADQLEEEVLKRSDKK